ncbi:DUF1573 domain-containing protein [Saltatorellus ferox]
MNHSSPRRQFSIGLPVALLAASGFAVSAFASATGTTTTSAALTAPALVQQGGRGSVTDKTPPPKPVTVPAKRVQKPVTSGPAPVEVVKGESGVGANDGPAGGAVKGMTPEQLKQQEEYLAKQKAAGADKGGAARGAVPRPPRNANAKLEIEFGSDKHDFGLARQGDQLTHVFEMKSAGSEPLIISQASPTCGCTLGEVKVKQPGEEVATLYKFGDEIMPGADIELEATLDTTSKSNRTNVRINVYSNDGTAGQNQLQLMANVEPFIDATPKFLQLGEIREGVSKTASVDFRTSSGEAIMLTQDDSRPIPMPQGLSLNVEAINPNDEGKSNHWRATFTIAEDSTAEPKGYMLRLNSDVPLPESKAHAAKPGAVAVYQASTNINYNILGALSLQPQYVSLGLVRPGQTVVRNVRLTCHEPEFDLSNVSVEITGEQAAELAWADRFAASVKPVSGSNAVDIELRLTGLPDDADGSFRGRVNIKTGHPSKPEEFFRFSGVCRKLAGEGGTPVQRPGGAQKAPVKKGDSGQ